MFAFFDLQTILLIITAALNTFLGFLIYAKRRTLVANQLYALNIVFIVWWIAAMIIYRTTTENLLWWTIILYATPTAIASTFLYFSLFFPDERVPRKRMYLAGILFSNLLVLAITFIPGYVIVGVTHDVGTEPVITFGPLYLIYSLYISGFFLLGLLLLARKYLLFDDPIKRRQISYLLVGYLVASNLAMLTNLLLPWLGYFTLNWLGQVLTVFMVLPVTYAIFKHRLFAAHVIAAEILILSLWIFLLAQTLLAGGTLQRFINGGLLAAVVIIGLLLLRSVNREVRAREEVERLAKDLEKANARLKELDKLKSEFVSIASHQLRSPLTAIKGYTSLLLEGSFGAVPPGIKEALERIFESSKNMALSIDDFLNVSRIEQGRMKYELSEFDLGKVASDVVEDLRPLIEEKGLKVNVRQDQASHKVYADVGKMKQVFSNLIDNALKYTPSGSITVSVQTDSSNKKVLVAISDTGVGMSKETIGKLFDKFTRAANANEVNVMGTGLGLYVAKQMVEAHKGRILVSSPGEGKGSTFTVELPGKA